MELKEAYDRFGPLDGGPDDSERQEAGVMILAELQRIVGPVLRRRAPWVHTHPDVEQEAVAGVCTSLLQHAKGRNPVDSPPTVERTRALLATMLVNAAISIWRRTRRWDEIPDGFSSWPVPNGTIEDELATIAERESRLVSLEWVEKSVTEVAVPEIGATIRGGGRTFTKTVLALQEIAAGRLTVEQYLESMCGQPVSAKFQVRFRQQVCDARLRMSNWLGAQETSGRFEAEELTCLRNYITYMFDPNRSRHSGLAE